ncbi:MAG: HNH endonuclease [Epsilonproteobacteria bacterium]|nr:MAG: HNH endonuclease [Campylobacterota bacterium]
MTRKKLMSILKYDKTTGAFYWKINTKNGKRKIGDTAGTITNGYIQIKYEKKNYLAHRLAWLYETGSFPLEAIDHINHSRYDNRWINLREVSYLKNGQNHSKHKDNSSGCTGVSWHKNNKKWQSFIIIKGEFISLGSYDKFSCAVDARKNAEVLYGFHTNHGK